MEHFFKFMFSLFGGPGAAYVESKGTKVSSRTHHTGDIIMYNKEKQWIINFTARYVKTLTSLPIWGPGGRGGGGASIIRLGLVHLPSI